MPIIQTIRKPATSVRKGKLPDPNTYKIVYILVDQYLGGGDDSHPEVYFDPGNNSYCFK